MGSDSMTEKSAQKQDGEKKKKAIALAPIAKPLAGKKLCKRNFKLVRRAAEHKCLKRGVKEVTRAFGGAAKGYALLLGTYPRSMSSLMFRSCVKRFHTYTSLPKKYVATELATDVTIIVGKEKYAGCSSSSSSSTSLILKLIMRATCQGFIYKEREGSGTSSSSSTLFELLGWLACFLQDYIHFTFWTTLPSLSCQGKNAMFGGKKG